MFCARGLSSAHLSAARAGFTLLAAAITAGAIAASCTGSGSGEAADADACLSNRRFFEQRVWSGFMAQNCAKCHTPDGTAVADSHARFVLMPTSYPGFVDANLSNLAEMAKLQYEGMSTLLRKPLGEMNHGGGAVLTQQSDSYKALVELLDRLGKTDTCTDEPNAALQAVGLADGPRTLRWAALDLVGRLPTDDELASVKQGGDASLGAALDGFMKEPAFLDRVREIYNDVLLTDAFLSSATAALDTMNTDDYPALAPYRDSKNPAYSSPERPLISQALAREPLDLIAYVVANGKPFTDVVAADYTVVNPFSAIAYGAAVMFANPKDATEFHEAKVTLSTGVAVPHAGLLSTPMFLNRWQTSPTNRNRGRARRVSQFFLATDILQIALRPVDATKLTAVENPTRNSSLCTVCHSIIDPIAGGFRGYDDRDYENFDPNRAWHDDMALPGFDGTTMDPSYYPRGLQWLGPRVATDPRFAMAAVRTVFHGLTGHDPLPYPADETQADFTKHLQAWESEDGFFRATADAFMKAGYDLKVVFKSVIMSPYYRAVSAPKGTDPTSLVNIGLGRMLTPEMLNRKIQAITGYRWRKTWDWTKPHDWLLEDYRILFGGIDSKTTITRLNAPNGLITGVAARLANEASCKLTAWDFTQEQAVRRFFPHIELNEVPESAGHPVPESIANIKKSLQYLHQLFLGETLELDDPEMTRSYQLFLDTWHELQEAGDNSLSWECSARVNPLDGSNLPTEVQITMDPNFTLRSWMAVLTYLMNDYAFLYE